MTKKHTRSAKPAPKSNGKKTPVMTPGAQIAAAIEVLEAVHGFWDAGKAAPVDGILGNYFRTRRFIGSKDKGFISRRVYGALRSGASLQWWVEQGGLPTIPRSVIIALLATEERLPLTVLQGYFSGNGYDPHALDAKEQKFISNIASYDVSAMPEWMRLNMPEWLLAKLKKQYGKDVEAEIAALNIEAPFDIRVNTLKTDRDKARARLRDEGFQSAPTPMSPHGLRLEKRGALFTTETFKNGWVEVQDEGSQLAALLVDAKPGQKVIDFCAGAGGKTLALAAQMKNKGRILAWDTSEIRLEQAPKRFARAGVDNVQKQIIKSESDPFIKRHKDSADRVLVDAPCTGSGTWRRNPDLKWRMQPTDLAEMNAIQAKILDSAARLVKPGGRMIYATCSLLDEENEDQVKQFLSKFPDFRVVSPAEIWNNQWTFWTDTTAHYLRLTPHQHGTDGFFAAVLEKRA